MKKTIVAAAVAALVAAPAAFADVSVSGQINQEFFKTDGGDLDSDLNSDIVFKASEDLGNGMKASAVIAINYDDGEMNGDGTTGETSEQSIALSGDFGTVKVGRQETVMESRVMAMAANDASDNQTNEITGNNGSTLNAGVSYVSPSFNGLTVIASGHGTTGSDDLDVTNVGVEYSNAGLTVKYVSEDDAGTDNDALALSYTMGDLTVGAVMMDTNGTDKAWYGAKYNMGANTIAVSTVRSDAANEDDTILSLSHALSKRTSAYLVIRNDEDSAADVTLVGVKHSF